MKKLNVYSSHKGSSPDRFDTYNTKYIVDALSLRFDVKWTEYTGDGNFIFKGVPITHGSILIFEFEDTGEFRTYDFGDNPRLTVQLSKNSLFRGAAIGQYNPRLWDNVIQNKEIRSEIKASIYPETFWQLGNQNYEDAQQYRASINLDNRLHWRGSLYSSNVPAEYLGVRKALEVLPSILSPAEFHFGHYPIPFETYIQEALQFKLALSIGGGGGYICGDFCLRDIEMFGLGIPVLRPTYAVEVADPLIPNHHYIAVDTDFTDEFRYKNPEVLASKIAQRYREVINATDYLQQVANNARNWYITNMEVPTITDTILKALNL
jgi:hypothetical protein